MLTRKNQLRLKGWIIGKRCPGPVNYRSLGEQSQAPQRGLGRATVRHVFFGPSVSIRRWTYMDMYMYRGTSRLSLLLSDGVPWLRNYFRQV